MMNIVCVYRTGGKTYNTEYVKRLSKSVYDNSGIKLTCLSDDLSVATKPLRHIEWSGWWSKMEIFNPILFSGEGILYFDLDTIITNDLSDIIETCENNKNTPIMLRDFYYPERLASGMMWLPYKHRTKVWERWITDPDDIMHKCRDFGDQQFIANVIGNDSLMWQNVCPGQVASYKADLIKTSPRALKVKPLEDTSKISVVCYHGQPRPHETNWDSGLK